MKKQLLFVINHLTVGGIQKTLISALKVIDHEKYDVTVYLRKNRTDLLDLIDERVNVIINTDKTRYYRKPKAVVYQLLIKFNELFGRKEKAQNLKEKLTDLIREYSMRYEQKTYFSDKKYDIAIAYAHGYPAYFVADYVMADKKIIFFHVSTNELSDVHKKFISEFDKAAVVHDRLVKSVSEWYPCLADKTFVVENYVDAELIKHQSTEKGFEKTAETVLCSCGRFAHVKGFDIAVEAAEILRKIGTNFVWYFVGDGPEKSRTEKLASEHGVSENIVFTGMQNNPYPYIANCDIFVQPSREEAWGLAIAEANRLCKPVVSTATVGGMKLIDNHKNGMLCEICPEAIAEAVEKLIGDKDLYKAIISNLENTDYSGKEEKYKLQWNNLLEE